jgi:hypothetical protein
VICDVAVARWRDQAELRPDVLMVERRWFHRNINLGKFSSECTNLYAAGAALLAMEGRFSFTIGRDLS